ncbi:MAG: bifunctional DNA-formamidopyrimidine glycosylase/DNA-(apurinic or apyrimidinic site) lyase [Akkermansiaceae bacterium]|nr:bifunctional DNA-formamidopyrimidine glycosylase/DNA-(apurinic or apyrimidinic site) lyase [Verrucomicrobiales bacterium]
MPELPEVEVLVRHLAPLIQGRKIHQVEVRRAKVLAPTDVEEFSRVLLGATFTSLTRRGKYLLFGIRPARQRVTRILLGHLGMTGRMYVQSLRAPLPRHAAVILKLGRENFIFEDTRYFGRLTLETAAIDRLGPEPLGCEFTVAGFSAALKRSAQPIKVKLLDQQLVAGVGNIYASEALFRAGISPRTAARRLKPAQVARLWHSIRETLNEAIACGSTIPLNFDGEGKRDGLFYFGRSSKAPAHYGERLQVYDRQGEPCVKKCGGTIKRLVQAARSTYFCSHCQSA